AASTSLLEPNQAEAFQQYQQARSGLTPVAERVFSIRASDEWNQALKTLVKECAPRAARIDTLLGELVASQQDLITSDTADLDAQASQVRWAIVLAALIGGLIGAAIAYFSSRSVTRPARSLLGLATAMAEGDLSRAIDVDTQDEMGDLARALAEATERMREAL